MTLSSIRVIKITSIFHTRLENIDTFFVLLRSNLHGTSFVLNFLGEGADFRRRDSTFFIKIGSVIFNEANPLVDINSLIIGVIEEGDNLKNLFSRDTAVFSILFREVLVGGFEVMREKFIPKLESLLFRESNVKIVREGGEVLSRNGVVLISNFFELALQVFEGIMIGTTVQSFENGLVVVLGILDVLGENVSEEVSKISEVRKASEESSVHGVSQVEGSEVL